MGLNSKIINKVNQCNDQERPKTILFTHIKLGENYPSVYLVHVIGAYMSSRPQWNRAVEGEMVTCLKAHEQNWATVDLPSEPVNWLTEVGFVLFFCIFPPAAFWTMTDWSLSKVEFALFCCVSLRSSYLVAKKMFGYKCLLQRNLWGFGVAIYTGEFWLKILCWILVPTY